MSDKPDHVEVSLTLEASGHLCHFVIDQMIRLRRHKPTQTLLDTDAIRDRQIKMYADLYVKLSDGNDLMMGKKP
jgi:hypothetical protein